MFFVWIMHSQTYLFVFELILTCPLFLAVHHVHIQPAVTKASSTKLSPSRALRADIVVDEPFPKIAIGTPGLLQEQDSKPTDVVGDLISSNFGVVVN
jgi:hypothetical protein